MVIRLIASPFVEVPRLLWGGTDLFIANLAVGIKDVGHEVVACGNRESKLLVEVRWLYPQSLWPLTGDFSETLKEINRTAWAIRDAADFCDVIHVNSLHGLPPSHFCRPAIVYTIHRHHEQALSELYSYHPDVHFVTISKFQQRLEGMPSLQAMHHGIDLSLYLLPEKKQGYLSFLGRIAPFRGTHLAIEVARNCGIPLKIAGEVQPMSQEYFDTQVKPHFEGKLIQYVGEVDLQTKNELLGNSLAVLFPIEWDEPFGLFMVEAMACGTSVLALPGGTAAETISDGVSGYACQLLDEMADYARGGQTLIRPSAVRRYVEHHFAAEHMASEYGQLYSQVYENASAKKGKGTAGSGGLTTTA